MEAGPVKDVGIVGIVGIRREVPTGVYIVIPESYFLA